MLEIYKGLEKSRNYETEFTQLTATVKKTLSDYANKHIYQYSEDTNLRRHFFNFDEKISQINLYARTAKEKYVWLCGFLLDLKNKETLENMQMIALVKEMLAKAQIDNKADALNQFEILKKNNTIISNVIDEETLMKNDQAEYEDAVAKLHNHCSSPSTNHLQQTALDILAEMEINKSPDKYKLSTHILNHTHDVLIDDNNNGFINIEKLQKYENLTSQVKQQADEKKLASWMHGFLSAAYMATGAVMVGTILGVSLAATLISANLGFSIVGGLLAGVVAYATNKITTEEHQAALKDNTESQRINYQFLPKLTAFQNLAKQKARVEVERNLQPDAAFSYSPA